MGPGFANWDGSQAGLVLHTQGRFGKASHRLGLVIAAVILVAAAVVYVAWPPGREETEPVTCALSIAVATERDHYLLGQTILVVAELRNESAPVMAGQVYMNITRPTGLSEGPYPMFDDGTRGDGEAGDGRYTTTYTLAESDPEGAWSIRAVGKKDGCSASSSTNFQVYLHPSTPVLGVAAVQAWDEGWEGAPDDVIDAGEHGLIRVAVRNTGNDIARGIHATLSTRDPLVEVTDNYSGWADISPNQTQWPVDRGFQIRIDLANDKTSATLVLLGTYVNASNHRFSFAQELALPINKGFYAKLGSDKAAYTEGESVRLTSTVMATIHHLTNASVTVTLTGPAGLALGPYAMFDDGSHGDDIAGDGEYTYLTVLDQSSPTGSYNATVNATAVLGNYTFTAHDACSLYRYARDESGIWRMRLGKNALVQTTLMRYEDRLTLRKVVEALARQHGLILSPATILDITRRVSFWLEPVYQEIWQKIGQAPVVYVDETGEKVDGVNYWLWTFVTLTETLLVIRKRRSKNVLKEVLGEEFDGWIGCDGWKSYPAFAPNIQRDWAHLLREARELAQEYREAEPLYRGLKRIFDRVEKALKTDPPPQERERLARNARSAMRRWIKRPYKKRKVKSLAKKMDNGFAYWFSYITHPGIEPTNNMAEQSLREPVVQRKIMGCFRNHKGTHIYEVITSVLATWKKRGYNTSQMLAQTLTQQWART